MINTLRHIKINNTKNNDFFKDSLIPIFERDGSSKSKSAVLSPYFTRRIGIDKDNESSIIKSYFEKLSDLKIRYSFVNKKIAFDSKYPQIGKIKDEFNLLDDKFTNLDQIIFTSVQKHFKNIRLDEEIVKGTLIYSITQTLKLFISSDKNINKSKLLNFSIKLFYWIDSIFYELINNNLNLGNIRTTNSKLIYSGDITKHETFLLFCLFNNGIDIIYLNSIKDSLIESNPALSNCTYKVLLSLSDEQYDYKQSSARNKTIVAPRVNTIPEVNRNNRQKSSNMNYSRTSLNNIKSVEFSADIVIKKREFKGELEEVTSKANERIGYLSLPSVVLPTYFIRYIGVTNNIDEYKNSLFNVNKLLRKLDYVKIENRIPIGNPANILSKSKPIWLNDSYTINDIHPLLCKLNGTHALDFVSSSLLRVQILHSLELVFNLVFENQEKILASKVKNLTIKLLSWLGDYYDRLFKKPNYDTTDIPKLLYYGDIKPHEGLFLIFLYHLGVDIIYINTYEDKIFENLDQNLSFSSLYVNDNVAESFAFPTKETLVRQATVAFNASAEIDKIIHNDQDGVYKPWQFEKYKITPLTLKTTFDEFSMLWKEHSRFRTGFKVIDTTVYVPNLFVKISGTNEDKTTYFNFISALVNEPQALLINELPFTNASLTKQDIYRLANALERNGTINHKNLKSNPLYKFGYLDDNLQEKIIRSTELLFDLGMLKVNMDVNMKLKVLATILTMDKAVLELLQNFDYPNCVPKIIVYDSKESTFTVEDSIITSFLYINGFDICVLTPTGYNNFESHIENKYYDKFKLETKQFNLELPNLNNYKSKKQKGFWSNLFG